MGNLKILYDYEIFLRQKYGGVSRYFFELINGLSALPNTDVDVFMGINNSGYTFKQNVGILNSSRFSLADKLHFLLNAINKKKFKGYLAGKGNNYSLLHRTYYTDLGIKSYIPVISTVHDMTHELFPRYFSKGDNTAYYKKKCVLDSAGIVCVSETTKQDVINLYNIAEDNIRTIYHGITIKDDSASVPFINEPYILYVGQRWGYKNFNLLLSAYAHDKNLNSGFRLVCFGGGEFNLSEKLFIRKNGLQDKVMHLSGGDKMLISMYKFASVFVYTSLYEGFGFPPLEAMECGCPVVTSPGGSVKEVASDAAVYFNPADGNDLLNKLGTVLNDNELKSRLIAAGRQRAAIFTWDKCVSEHLKFYNEISN